MRHTPPAHSLASRDRDEAPATPSRRLEELCPPAIPAVHVTLLVVLLALSSSASVLFDFPLPALFGLLAAQTALITLWATCSTAPLRHRWGEAIWRCSGLCLVVLGSIALFNPGIVWNILWATPVSFGLCVAATWLPAWILRRLAGPLSRPALPLVLRVTRDPERAPWKYTPALRWLALVGGLAVLLPQLSYGPPDVDTIVMSFVVIAVLSTCLPIGVVATLLFWLVLKRNRTLARSITALMLAAAWLLVGITLFGRLGDGIFPYWIAGTVAAGTVLLTAALLRRDGWQLTRARQ